MKSKYKELLNDGWAEREKDRAKVTYIDRRWREAGDVVKKKKTANKEQQPMQGEALSSFTVSYLPLRLHVFQT